MHKKVKLFMLILVVRVFDILTTYIAGSGDLSGEMNILVRVFHLGWLSLIFSEVFLLVVVFVLLKLQTDTFYKDEEKKIAKENLSFNQYFSFIYFGKNISFLESLYSKIKYKVALNSFIYLFVITLVIVSILIGINNILPLFKYLNLYNFSGKFFHYNMPNILNISIFIFTTIFYHYLKYRQYVGLNEQNKI